MYKTSSNFRVSCFRNRVLIWTLLAILSFSFAPSASFAQQPTATIKVLSGEVLVSGQSATVGTALQAGDTIQTQAGASAVLELSDGSEIQLGENTQINIDDLSQTATGARVSYIKLLAGRLRALLSPGHQQEGSSFTIETPNAQLGVKFSQPDVEVSYDPEKQETVGIAHTVELIAINLLTDERIIVPVGSSVIIIGIMMKVIAGTTAAAIAAGTETAATGTATGMGAGTKVAIGVGAAAAAGGAVAVAVSSGDRGDSEDGGDSENRDENDNLSGYWFFSGEGYVEGCYSVYECCTPWQLMRPCCQNGPIELFDGFPVTHSGNTLSGFELDAIGRPYTLDGVVEGNSVSFTVRGSWEGERYCAGPSTTIYEGVIDDNDSNTIRGSFDGYGPWLSPYPFGEGADPEGTGTLTWRGNFTVTIYRPN